LPNDDEGEDWRRQDEGREGDLQGAATSRGQQQWRRGEMASCYGGRECSLVSDGDQLQHITDGAFAVGP